MNGERDWDRADSAVSIVYKSGNGRVKNKKKEKKRRRTGDGVQREDLRAAGQRQRGSTQCIYTVGNVAKKKQKKML